MDTQSRRLLARLERARRRARWTLAARIATSTAVYWLIGIATCVGLWGLGDEVRLLAAIGAAAGLTATLSAVAWRSPTLEGTARLLDEKLSLEQRLESALEALSERTEVAALLRKDALLSLEGLDLTGVFPLRLLPRRRRPWLTAVALAVALLTARWLVVPAISPPPQVAGGVPGGRAPGTSETAVATAVRGDLNALTTGTASPLTPSQPDPVMKSERAAADSWTPGIRTSGDAGPDDVERSLGREVAGLQDPALESPGFERGRAEPSGDDRHTGSPKPGQARVGSLESATPERQGARHAGTSREGSGTGGAAAAGLGGSSGAETDSPLEGAGDAASEAGSASSEPRRADPTIDWRGLEAALARERFPPGLEHHIRDYFLALAVPRS